MSRSFALVSMLALLAVGRAGAQSGAGPLTSADLLRLRSVSDVQLPPDGTRLAYTVVRNDGLRRPYGQIWIMTLPDGRSVRLGGETDASSNPEWSPDGQWLAYRGRSGERSGLVVARADGASPRFVAEMLRRNSPLPTTGKTIAWAPGSKQIAFVSGIPGPETAEAAGIR